MKIVETPQNLVNYRKYLAVVRAIKEYLNTQNYLELDLPVLLPALIPESYLEVFETEFKYLDQREKLYLTPSPELLIKRLLVSGIGSSYFLGKSFRNSEPNSPKHTPEFTMLEFYKVGANYMDLAEEVLHLLQYIAIIIKNKESVIPSEYRLQADDEESRPNGRKANTHIRERFLTSYRNDDQEVYKIQYQGHLVDLSTWEKLTVAEAFSKYANISKKDLFDEEKFRERAKEKGYVVCHSELDSESRINTTGSRVEARDDSAFSYEELFSQIYAQEIEPYLGCNGYPTLLYDYPTQFAALSRPAADGKTSERFEFYIAGVELGNCYSELADWSLQEARLKAESKLRRESGKIDHPLDWGFIDSLKKGLPDCAGIAIGVDRLAMIFADCESIDDLKLISIS